MHELSVVESMIAIVLKHAQANGARKVKKINLVLGEMSTIMEEPVRFYFEIIGKDTIAEGAELAFERKPLIAMCSSCGCEFGVSNYDFTCPKCGALDTEIISGREFRVDSIEIE